MSLSNKNILITSGFPRSGNTFLNFVLWQLYYPKEEINNFFHTTKVIQNNNKIVMPIRKPSDCISSWHNFAAEDQELSASCKYYLRFHKKAKEMNDNIIFLDFYHMTNSIDYIKKTIEDNYNITTNLNTTVEETKTLMINKKRKWNLPRNNQKSLNKTKDDLSGLEEFKMCEELYQKIIEDMA